MIWYLEEGPEQDVVISTRVRYARNIANMPFPWRLSPEERDYVKVRVADAFGKLCDRRQEKALTVNLDELGDIESLALSERRVISRSMLRDTRGKALLLFPDESSGILVNEEDHLRLFALSSGLRLDETKMAAEACAIAMEERLPFAKSERYGYLTACPTNTGTGMRASVMMHLPGLARTGVLNKIAEQLSKTGYALRGAKGEGSSAEADMIQLSNQVTLGVTEEQILEAFGRLVLDVADEERRARRALYEHDPVALEDEIGRAEGQLMFAGKMSAQEAYKLLSLLRLGRELNIAGMPDYPVIQRLLNNMGEGSVQQEAGRTLDKQARDIRRAAILRNTLNGGNRS